MEEATELFELAAEEMQVCLRVRGVKGRHQLVHFLRPPTYEDWWQYERNLRSTVESIENEGEEALRFEANSSEAAATLYDRLFRRAEGYRSNADRPIAADQIPVHHKEMVIRALGEVGPLSPPEEASGPAVEVPFSLDSENVEVALEASRNGKTYRNLLHVFRTPSAADRVEYSRITAQALYVRGAKTLRSILPSRLPGLAALYDRLIEEVRGYAAAGAPLADRAAIVRQMDPLHKKVAVQVLLGE